MYYYNDCASELKNLYTPFGIWLPIHSSNQVNEEEYRVDTVDLSNDGINDRLDYLINHSHKLMTIVYIGGHVFMYVGAYPDPQHPGHKIALSYQNVWGLKPKNHPLEGRSIIGEAVFFPILKKYPEDLSLESPADRKYFKIAYLDVTNDQPALQKIDLYSLISP